MPSFVGIGKVWNHKKEGLKFVLFYVHIVMTQNQIQ